MRRLCLFLLFILSASSAGAQLGVGRRARRGDVPPKAMFIILLTRQAQREHLMNTRPEYLPQFDKDVAEVMARTVKDWSHNFRYCPVYFFVDTMEQKIRNGQWAGVLLDTALKPAANLAVNPDDNVYIGYFGSPLPQLDATAARGALGYSEGYDATSLIRERLLVTDSKFRLLPDRLPHTNYVRAVRPAGMSYEQYRQYRKELSYDADRWYVDYMPVAYSYDKTLQRFFGRKR